MLAFRKLHPALQRGTIETLDAPEGVLAFIRAEGGERLLCVFNMSEKPVVYTMPAAAKESGAPGVASEPEGGKVSLEPFGAYIGVL